MKPSFAIVGCGKVGTALGLFLTRAGYPTTGLASKNRLSAQQTARMIQSDLFTDLPWEISRKADIVFITTPDGSIADTCNRISQHQGFLPDSVVLHCSGALPSTLLSAAKRCGAFIGSMHPLQSFASVDHNSNPFQDIILSIEGEKKAVETANKIATDLGGSGMTILTEGKTLYHASAVVASNYLVTLLNFATRLMGKAGISDKDAFAVLKPLIQGTLANIENVGTLEALTGPIVRGDLNTVKTHIEEIEEKQPEFLMLYKTLGFHTIDLAAAQGAISESTIEQLKKFTTS